MLYGVFLVQEVLYLMSPLYQFRRQCIVINSDPLNRMLYHFDDVIVNNELLMAPGYPRLQHTHAIDQVGTSQGRQQRCYRFLVRRLGIGQLGVCLRSSNVAGQVVVLGKLGHGSTYHTELRSPHRCINIGQV